MTTAFVLNIVIVKREKMKVGVLKVCKNLSSINHSKSNLLTWWTSSQTQTAPKLKRNRNFFRSFIDNGNLSKEIQFKRSNQAWNVQLERSEAVSGRENSRLNTSPRHLDVCRVVGANFQCSIYHLSNDNASDMSCRASEKGTRRKKAAFENDRNDLDVAFASEIRLPQCKESLCWLKVHQYLPRGSSFS